MINIALIKKSDDTEHRSMVAKTCCCITIMYSKSWHKLSNTDHLCRTFLYGGQQVKFMSILLKGIVNIDPKSKINRHFGSQPQPMWSWNHQQVYWSLKKFPNPDHFREFIIINLISFSEKVTFQITKKHTKTNFFNHVAYLIG